MIYNKVVRDFWGHWSNVESSKPLRYLKKCNIKFSISLKIVIPLTKPALILLWPESISENIKETKKTWWEWTVLSIVLLLKIFGHKFRNLELRQKNVIQDKVGWVLLKPLCPSWRLLCVYTTLISCLSFIGMWAHQSQLKQLFSSFIVGWCVAQMFGWTCCSVSNTCVFIFKIYMIGIRGGNVLSVVVGSQSKAANLKGTLNISNIRSYDRETRLLHVI